MLNKGQPETVKLTRKLPAVAARNGSTVRFVAEIAGSSIPTETATILREQIRTLLLHSKTGEIQLVDGPADTEIKCILTSYEPKVLREAQRQVGTTTQKIETWIGNISASVQVLDSHDHPIDAANLKNHLENDFVVSQQQSNGAAASKPPFGIKMPGFSIKGHQILNGTPAPPDSGANGKGGRPPTDSEWKESLVGGLAMKVANRIVPVDDEVVAVLPVEKQFIQIRELAKTGHWGNVQEEADKMGTLPGGVEADRLYLLGLSFEALGYQEADTPKEASESLTKASKYYADAGHAKPNEREMLLAQLRAQDAVDHYVEIQRFLQNAPKNKPLTKKGGGSPTESERDAHAADNAAVMEMTQAGMPESVVLTFIQTAPDPKFDISSTGLIDLSRAHVLPAIMQAIQKRMTSAATPAPATAAGAAAPPAARSTRSANRRVSASKPVQ